MHIYVAMDSFKGSLSSLEAGNTVRDAIRSVDPHASVTVTPIADGGEGTVDALAALKGSRIISKTVCGPLRKPVNAQYCILSDGTAVIEMAAAAGLPLLPAALRNPLHTTTFGVGELILDALDHGCREFIIGIGGSATNDGGTGMLTALGYRFTDRYNEKIACSAEGLQALAHISREMADPRLAQCTFRIACDVKNPLCGPEGCSVVYGPQKGADMPAILQMDKWLKNFATLSGGDPNMPGSGAAGGLGFAFRTFLNAELCPGIDIVINKLNVAADLQDADMVITGEGRLDSQSAQGKTPFGVAQLSKKFGKTVIAFAGSIDTNTSVLPFDACFSIVPGPCSLEKAMDKDVARNNLFRTVQQVFRLLWLK